MQGSMNNPRLIVHTPTSEKTKGGHIMKRLEISMLFALIFCALVSILALNGEYDQVRDSVLRLHILANSDSLYDQELKLKVRDALQAEVDEVFGGCENLEQAIFAAECNADTLRRTAEETLRASGCDYSVKISVEPTMFDTRTYDGITLPAGEYTALRVEIGEAKGRNWWCVMFPAMCVTGRDSRQELDAVLTDGQVSLLEADGYDIRFRCVEWYEAVCRWLGI